MDPMKSIGATRSSESKESPPGPITPLVALRIGKLWIPSEIRIVRIYPAGPDVIREWIEIARVTRRIELYSLVPISLNEQA